MALLSNVINKGTHAARPAAGSAGVLYFETDTSRLFRDNGTSWDALDPLTSAGDLPYFDGTSLKRLAVGTTGQVLAVAAGEPVWATLGAASRVLNYNATTDLNTATALTAGTWVTVGSAHSFTVASASDQIMAGAAGAVTITTTVSNNYGVRLNLDSGAQTYVINGATQPVNTGQTMTLGTSVGGVALGTLTAGSHTVAMEVLSNSGSANLYCRPGSQPNLEGLALWVIEL